MDYQLLIDTAVLAGEIIMESGGEAYRVEETVTRMLNISGAKHVEVVVLGTCLVATLSHPGTDAVTVTRRIRFKGNNLNRVSGANSISRALCSGEMDLEQAFKELKRLRKQEQYPEWVRCLASMTVSFGFTYMFGGRVLDLVVSALCGAAAYLVHFLNRYFRSAGFINETFAAFAVALVAFLGSLVLPGLQTDKVIIGALMTMVPGVAITNSARDILAGDYVSGTARVMEAVVTAASIALGTGLVLILQNALAA